MGWLSPFPGVPPPFSQTLVTPYLSYSDSINMLQYSLLAYTPKSKAHFWSRCWVFKVTLLPFSFQAFLSLSLLSSPTLTHHQVGAALSSCFLLPQRLLQGWWWLGGELNLNKADSHGPTSASLGLLLAAPHAPVTENREVGLRLRGLGGLCPRGFLVPPAFKLGQCRGKGGCQAFPQL